MWKHDYKCCHSENAVVFIFSDYSNSTNTEVFAMPIWLPGQSNTDQYTHFCFLSSFLSIKIKKKIQLLTLQPGNWKHPFALPVLLASVQREEWQSWNRHKTRNLNTDEAIIVHSVADDHPQHSHRRSCIFSSLQYSYKNNSVKLHFPWCIVRLSESLH